MTSSGAHYSKAYATHQFKIAQQQQANAHAAVFRKGNLGWVQQIPSPPSSDAVTIRLQPVATVTGRLLMADKSPLSGAQIQAIALVKARLQDLPETTTDVQGHFQLTLLPGVKYILRVESSEFELATTVDPIAIEPGETKSLGELQLVGRNFLTATAADVGSSSTATRKIQGRAVGPAGRDQDDGVFAGPITTIAIVTRSTWRQRRWGPQGRMF